MRGPLRLFSLVAAAIVAAIDIAYLSLVEGGAGRVRFVGASLAAAALFAVVGAVLRRGFFAVTALSVSASILLIWAFLAIFSIGILIAIPAVLVLVSLSQAIDERRPLELLLGVAAMAATFAITVFGISAT